MQRYRWQMSRLLELLLSDLPDIQECHGGQISLLVFLYRHCLLESCGPTERQVSANCDEIHRTSESCCCCCCCFQHIIFFLPAKLKTKQKPFYYSPLFAACQRLEFFIQTHTYGGMRAGREGTIYLLKAAFLNDRFNFARAVPNSVLHSSVKDSKNAEELMMCGWLWNDLDSQSLPFIDLLEDIREQSI